MDSLTSLVYQLEGSIRKIKTAREAGELTQDTADCLTHLLQAARVLAMEERKKYPNGYKEPDKEPDIQITGLASLITQVG